MVDQVKGKDRIPFEHIEQSESVESWQLPSMQSGGKVIRSAKRGEAEKKSNNVAIENVSSKKRPRHLTAEELQQITEEARLEGFNQGLKEGTEQGIREGTKAGEKAGNQRAYLDAKKEIEALQNQLRQLAVRLFEPMQNQDQQLENILVDLVLSLSKSLILSEVSVNPATLLNVIQHVLSSLPKGESNIRVQLNAADAALIESLVPESQRDWRIQVNDALSSGGCHVETQSSLVDFSVENRIESYMAKIGGLSGRDVQDLPPLPDYHGSDSSQAEVSNEQEPPKEGEPSGEALALSHAEAELNNEANNEADSEANNEDLDRSAFSDNGDEDSTNDKR